MSRQKTQQRSFTVILTSPNGVRNVPVKASTADVAAKRAEKRNPGWRATNVIAG